MVVDIDSYVDKIKTLAEEQARAGTELDVARQFSMVSYLKKKISVCLITLWYRQE